MVARDFPDLSRLLSPRSVAILGASERPRSVGSDTLLNLAEHSDFDGQIFPVNPGRERVHGLRAYSAMSALPGPVDVAVVCLPADAVVGALRDCAAAGTGFAVVFTSGFGETGDEGRAVEAEMAEIARQSGMRIYGPNSPGLSNINRRLGLTFSPVFKNDTLGGGIGLVTQGGGLGRAFIQASERGIGVGLVDEIGDFKDTLEAAAEAGGCEPTARWIRPSRSIGQRLFNRTGIGQQNGGNLFTEGLQRLLTGGIYYLDPGYIGGDYPGTSS